MFIQLPAICNLAGCHQILHTNPLRYNENLEARNTSYLFIDVAKFHKHCIVCYLGFCVSNLSVVDIPLDKKDGDEASHVVVMPTPSKRGRKKKVTMSVPRIGGGAGHPNETLILAHLSATGQVKMAYII